jgi:hypothetical protein
MIAGAAGEQVTDEAEAAAIHDDGALDFVP